MARIFSCIIWTLQYSFVYNIKTDDFYKDIADEVNAGFDTSGDSYSRALPIGVNKKIIRLMKDELGGRIMTEFAYKIPSGSGDKNCKRVKKCIVKRTLDFNDYKQCLLAGQNAFRKQLLFHNKLHEVYMVEVNKLALSRDNDK